jgi:hypothetical protein
LSDSKKRLGFVLAVIVLLVLAVAAPEPAFAQCAMCKEALANSTEAADSSRNFNFAILVLLIPPVVMFAGIFGLIYRSNKSQVHQ